MKNNCHVHTAPTDTDQLSLTGEKMVDLISISMFSRVKINANRDNTLIQQTSLLAFVCVV